MHQETKAKLKQANHFTREAPMLNPDWYYVFRAKLF